MESFHIFWDIFLLLLDIFLISKPYFLSIEIFSKINLFA